ncbi:MAG: CRISPR-associated protein Cas5 [Candidatus Parvarchaeota archaeon]
MKCFSFKLSGRLGHFRKFYTTASALSYDFPPPATIKGLIGAITGCKEYISATEGLKIGIVVEKLEGRLSFGLNLLNIKNRERPIHTQAKRQILVKPSYIIHVCGEGDLFETFANMVQEGKSHYHPYLGKTSYPAFIEPIGFQEAKFCEKHNSICGVFSVECICNPIELLKQGYVLKDRIPLSFQEGRQRPKYGDVFYKIEARPLSGDFKNIYKIGADYVYLFSS